MLKYKTFIQVVRSKIKVQRYFSLKFDTFDKIRHLYRNGKIAGSEKVHNRNREPVYWTVITLSLSHTKGQNSEKVRE